MAKREGKEEMKGLKEFEEHLKSDLQEEKECLKTATGTDRIFLEGRIMAFGHTLNMFQILMGRK